MTIKKRRETMTIKKALGQVCFLISEGINSLVLFTLPKLRELHYRFRERAYKLDPTLYPLSIEELNIVERIFGDNVLSLYKKKYLTDYALRRIRDYSISMIELYEELDGEMEEIRKDPINFRLEIMYGGMFKEE